MKKKCLFIILTIVILVIVTNVVTIKNKAKQVEQELRDTKVFLSFVPEFDSGLNWSRKFWLFNEEFIINNGLVLRYVVGSFNSRYERNLVEFNFEGVLHRFPEDLWIDGNGEAKLFYPGVKAEHTKEPLYTKLAVSFDRPYSIDEISQMEILESADWFWVDTYQTETSYCDYYRPVLDEEYSAYGIESSISSLKEDAITWCDTINLYEEDTSTVSGKKILKIKKGISKNEEIELEDLKIIGCSFRQTGYERDIINSNPMFKCIYNW